MGDNGISGGALKVKSSFALVFRSGEPRMEEARR